MLNIGDLEKKTKKIPIKTDINNYCQNSLKALGMELIFNLRHLLEIQKFSETYAQEVPRHLQELKTS